MDKLTTYLESAFILLLMQKHLHMYYKNLTLFGDMITTYSNYKASQLHL